MSSDRPHLPPGRLNFPSFEEALRHTASFRSSSTSSHSSSFALSIGAQADLNQHLRQAVRFGIDPPANIETSNENDGGNSNNNNNNNNNNNDQTDAVLQQQVHDSNSPQQQQQQDSDLNDTRDRIWLNLLLDDQQNISRISDDQYSVKVLASPIRLEHVMSNQDITNASGEEGVEVYTEDSSDYFNSSQVFALRTPERVKHQQQEENQRVHVNTRSRTSARRSGNINNNDNDDKGGENNSIFDHSFDRSTDADDMGIAAHYCRILQDMPLQDIPLQAADLPASARKTQRSMSGMASPRPSQPILLNDTSAVLSLSAVDISHISAAGSLEQQHQQHHDEDTNSSQLSKYVPSPDNSFAYGASSIQSIDSFNPFGGSIVASPIRSVRSHGSSHGKSGFRSMPLLRSPPRLRARLKDDGKYEHTYPIQDRPSKSKSATKPPQSMNEKENAVNTASRGVATAITPELSAAALLAGDMAALYLTNTVKSIVSATGLTSAGAEDTSMDKFPSIAESNNSTFSFGVGSSEEITEIEFAPTQDSSDDISTLKGSSSENNNKNSQSSSPSSSNDDSNNNNNNNTKYSRLQHPIWLHDRRIYRTVVPPRVFLKDSDDFEDDQHDSFSVPVPSPMPLAPLSPAVTHFSAPSRLC